jgi:acyl carrier protein
LAFSQPLSDRSNHVEELGVKPRASHAAGIFIEDLEADSLDVVELVTAFEEEFGSNCRTKTPKSSRLAATSSNIERKLSKQ